MIRSILVAWTIVVGFMAQAHAAITFHGAAYADIRQPAISLRGTGALASAASGNITPALSSVGVGNLLMCVVEQHDNVAIAFPAGWTQLYSISTTTTQRASTFYKVSGAAESNPLITHSGGNAIIARCFTFYGVDASSPFDVAFVAQYAANAASVGTPALTTLSAGDWVLFVPNVARSATIATPTGNGGVIWSSTFYSSTALGLGASVGLFRASMVSPGTVGPLSATLSASAENEGVLLALHNGSRISINVPAGTVAGDVMVAAIGVTPGTTNITPPAGWTQRESVTQTLSTSNRLVVYYRVASASEPAGYTWTLASSHSGAVGGILSYGGVDTANPIDISASQVTGSATTHVAPSLTTRYSSDMLITVHEFASSRSWTPPAGMTERVNVTSRGSSSAGNALEMNELLLGVAGATGTKTATAAGNADRGATASIALKASLTSPDHIRIEYSGTASFCATKTITLKACTNPACTPPHFQLSDVTGINLSPTGAGYTWSPSNTVSILAANGGVNNSTTIARSSSGTATLAITGTPSPAPSGAYECFNTATNTSGDCNLVFSGNFAFDLSGYTAGSRKLVSVTSCTSNFANTTRTLKFWSTYVNPASGTQTGKVAAGSANADCSTGYSALGTASGSASSLNLSFGSGTYPQATFSLCYPDVGQLQIDTSYAGSAANTPPDAGIAIVGNAALLSKPDHFSLSAVKCTTANAANCAAGALALTPAGTNPAASGAAGAAFMRAGDTSQASARFSATVTAKNALDVATPNFGRESTPEGVAMTAVLVEPVGGDPGKLTCKGSSSDCVVAGGALNFTSGATTVTDLAWNEVGIVRILPTIADQDYLGQGNVTTPTPSANIGRFIPDHFEVNPDALNPVLVRADTTQTVVSATGTTAPATVIGVDDTTGFTVGSKLRIPGAAAASAAFTATVTAVDAVALTLTLDTAIGTTLTGGESIVDEWGAYTGETMNAQFSLAATDAAGNTLQNYDGSYAKLNPAGAANPLGLGAVNAGTNLSARLDTSQSATGTFVKGVANVVLPFQITRLTSTHAPYSALKLGIAPGSAEADGVRMGSYDLNVAGSNDHTSIMDPLVQSSIELRHGRSRIANAYGSQLRPLPISVAVQYYNGSNWVTNVADSLTVLDTRLSPTGALAATVVSGLSGGLSVNSAAVQTISNGALTLILNAPNASGAANLSFTSPSYLPSASGRATFGIYRSPIIYQRENY